MSAVGKLQTVLTTGLRHRCAGAAGMRRVLNDFRCQAKRCSQFSDDGYGKLSRILSKRIFAF